MKFSEIITRYDVTVHCPTLENAKTLLAAAHEKGLRWLDGKSFLEKDNYAFFESETCYALCRRTYNPYNYYSMYNYKIVEFYQVEFDEIQTLPEESIEEKLSKKSNKDLIKRWRYSGGVELEVIDNDIKKEIFDEINACGCIEYYKLITNEICTRFIKENENE